MPIKKYSHIVPDNIPAKYRLSSYIIGVMPMLDTPSSAKKAIKAGRIYIKNRVGQTGDWVQPGSLIEYHLSFPEKKSDHGLDIKYEDEDLLIANKPAGIASSGYGIYNFQSKLKDYPISNKEDALPYPYLIHRLDRQTSGVIIAARTMTARRALGSMMEDHSFIKEYVCIVEGNLDSQHSIINHPIEGKEAKSEIIDSVKLQTKDQTSFVTLRIHSGRTHQIRRHMLHIGHPIVGDDIYNKDGLSFKRGLFLMASRIEFQHPIKMTMVNVRLQIAPKFMKYIK